jgi:hypothetical protein
LPHTGRKGGRHLFRNFTDGPILMRAPIMLALGLTLFSYAAFTLYGSGPQAGRDMAAVAPPPVATPDAAEDTPLGRPAPLISLAPKGKPKGARFVKPPAAPPTETPVATD